MNIYFKFKSVVQEKMSFEDISILATMTNLFSEPKPFVQLWHRGLCRTV